MALKLEELNEVLTEAGLDLPTRQKALAVARKHEEEKKEDREASSEPKSKNKFVVVMRKDSEQAWVLQMKEDADENTLIKQMTEASRDSNRNQKRKKRFVNTWRDMFLYLKRAYSKQYGFQPKTKEACRVILLPAEDIKFD